MKINAIIATAVIFTSLSGSPVYAVTDSGTVEIQIENPAKGNCGDWAEDPTGMLECKKSEILRLLNEGKISQEKADEMIKRIDARIAEIKEFNKLTLQQKKDKLIKDCKSRLNLLVKDGKIEKKKADEILKGYTEKIKQWDGTGYPKFFEKGMRGKRH